MAKIPQLKQEGIMSEKTSTLLRKYQRKTGRDIKQLKNMYKLLKIVY